MSLPFEAVSLPSALSQALTAGAPAMPESPARALSMGAQAAAAVSHVVMVLPTYIPESFGGAEQQSRKLGLALARLGVRVTLLAPRLRAETAKREQDMAMSLRRFRLRNAPNLGGRHMGSFLLWGVKLLWWLAWHRKEYEVIHIMHGRLHAVPAVLAGAVLGKPTLIKIGRGGASHFDLDLVRGKRLFGALYARAIVRHTTGYIANSREIVDDLRRWHIDARCIHQIPNGVELPQITPLAPRIDCVNFIYLGRLDPEKRLDLMIRGFGQLEDSSRAALTIAGDGTCRAELEQLVKQLGIAGRVTFTGTIRDVAAALRQADVFVSTSVSEGMSNALLEAMSFGLVPLVSLVSGVSEIVHDGRSGLLFAPDDLDAFVERLRTTLTMPLEQRRELGMSARATVEERFGIENVARQHVALYEDLVADRAR